MLGTPIDLVGSSPNTSLQPTSESHTSHRTFPSYRRINRGLPSHVVTTAANVMTFLYARRRVDLAHDSGRSRDPARELPHDIRRRARVEQECGAALHPRSHPRR